MKNYLELSPEVEKAIVEKRPVVALESTIISHGMPYPQNLETALKVEEIVRSYGAVPATIGIIKGKLKAGLTREELEYFATAKDIVKASRRDLPYITANKMNGATTVASTMIIAHMAGIINSYLKGSQLDKACTYATGASLTALKSYSTINPAMSESEIEKTLTDIEFEIKLY